MLTSPNKLLLFTKIINSFLQLSSPVDQNHFGLDQVYSKSFRKKKLRPCAIMIPLTFITSTTFHGQCISMARAHYMAHIGAHGLATRNRMGA